MHLRGVTGTVGVANSAPVREENPAFAGQVNRESLQNPAVQLWAVTGHPTGVGNSYPVGCVKPAFAGQV
ncbi:hypothetical protein, partial [Neptuniibacter sp.]|uniref:hypothetical protein n=1 Tax=Neptuniibacter sp. TaxID=1962643 RepID=UPI0026355AEE